MAASAYCKVSGSQVKFCAKNWRQSITTTIIFCGFIVELSVYTMTLINYLHPLKLGNEANVRKLVSNIKFMAWYFIVSRNLKRVKILSETTVRWNQEFICKIDSVFFLSIWFNIHIIVASHELYVRRAGHRKQETISGIFFCFYSFFFSLISRMCLNFLKTKLVI